MMRRVIFAVALTSLIAGFAGAGDEKQSTPAPTPADTKGKAVVLLETTLGNMKIELYPDKAPKTVENFLRYVKEGFYTDTIFHRVIPSFMVQGGGFTKDMSQKTPHAAIPIESKNGLKNLRGTIAMARTSDPNSATCQFFINHKDNPNLDFPKPDGNGYTVFGKVIEGIEVVDKIAAVETTSRPPHQNVPVEPVVIKGVKAL